jgi:hypothetical protein
MKKKQDQERAPELILKKKKNFLKIQYPIEVMKYKVEILF